MLFPLNSAIQSLPFRSNTILSGWLFGVSNWYSVNVPFAGLNCVALLPPNSAGQMLPSGPRVIPCGWLFAVGMGYSVIFP